MPGRARIAIVGGGITGLSVAYELTRHGRSDFVLYESSSRLGGIIETIRQGGFVIECGPDSWVTDKPWARELAAELGLEAEILVSNDAHHRTYLLQSDELVPMPDGMRMMVPSRLEAVAESPIFSEEAKQAYQREIGRADELKASAMARPPDVDESVATFVERHFGGEVAEKIAGPLLAGVFGGDVQKLSAKSVMAPLVKMEREYGSLILALQNRLDFEKDQPVFTTLRGGLQSLVERISQILAPGSVRLNETVLSVKSVTDGWEVATASTRASFHQVVLATPAHVTRQLVSTWSANLDKLLDFESTSSVVAALAFDPARAAHWEAPKGFGFLVSPNRAKRATGTELSLLACTFVEQKFPHRVPPGAKLLRAFYGDEAATTLLSASDSEVVTLAHRQLARVFGGLPQPTLSAVRRWPRSLPQYTVGHADRVVRAEAIVGGLPGLHLAGNALHGVGISDLVRQGRSIGVRLAS